MPYPEPRSARQKTSRRVIGQLWSKSAFDRRQPLQSGYDEFWGLRGGGVDYFRHDFGGEVDLWDGDAEVDEVGYLTDILADKTIGTLGKRKADGKPFFISLHFTAPHWPWEGNDEEGRAESERLNKTPSAAPGGVLHYDGGTLATYAKMMKSLDDNIGRVLQKLAELGLEDDTIVVFTSDNGGERFSDTWPFTGKKTELLEGGIRVPAIVRWPGVAGAGSQNTVPIISMDWLPTFVAAAGGRQDIAFPSDGVDIRPALSGGALPERSLFWRFGNMAQRAHRRGAHKYLKINDNEFLFDVVADPLERANLKERQPGLFAKLRAEWEQWDAGMLHDPTAPSFGSSPASLADHFNPSPPAMPPGMPPAGN